MKNHTKIFAAILSLSAVLSAGQAVAGGVVSGVTLDKASLTLGQSMLASVKGTVNQTQMKTGCAVRVSLKYADNSIEVVHPGFLVNVFPANDFYLKPTKAGAVKVIADGSSSTAWPACQQMAETAINVTEPIVVSAQPNLTVMPKPTMQPVREVSTMPGVSLQLPTLKSIKQVQYTNHSGETWIEVSGSGNCSYTIDGAGISSSFTSSAAKPFPMKVKIVNAPLGSHLWKAKGTGNCSGVAESTFSVE